MSEKVIIFDGKLKLESIGGCKRAVICFVAQAPSVTLEYEQAVCVVLDQEGQEQKAREIGAHFAKWGRVVMTFEPEDAMSEHADFVYSDFGEDGKNKSGLDAEKIRVVCARCQSTVNAKISYVAATDWFYVTVRFFGWECTRTVYGPKVRAVSHYELAFDHCGCVKLYVVADTPEVSR